MDTKFSLKKMETLTEVLEIVGDIAAIISLDYKVLFENSLCKKIHGENMGKHCYKAYANQKTVCDYCPCKSVLKHNKAARREFSCLDLDGNELFKGVAKIT